jgi:hypothetical protein
MPADTAPSMRWTTARTTWPSSRRSIPLARKVWNNPSTLAWCGLTLMPVLVRACVCVAAVCAGLRDRLRNVATSDFATLTYTEAVDLLQVRAWKYLQNVSLISCVCGPMISARHGGGEDSVREVSQLGRRLGVRARAVHRREGVLPTHHRHELPQGHQGLLHEAQRRQRDRRGEFPTTSALRGPVTDAVLHPEICFLSCAGHGHPGAQDRRTDRRLPEVRRYNHAR